MSIGLPSLIPNDLPDARRVIHRERRALPVAVCHVVTFTFKPGTCEEAIHELALALDGLASSSNALSYFHGRDLRYRRENADYAVAAVFESADAFATYLNSPEHLRIVRDHVAPYLQSRSGAQFPIEASARMQC